MLVLFYNWFTNWFSVQMRRGYLRILLNIPFVKGIVKNEISKVYLDYKNGLPKGLHEPMDEIPKKAWNKTEIIQRLDEYHDYEYNMTKSGLCSGIRFSDKPEIEEIAGEAAKRFLYTNMLYHAKSTPSRQMENEVISFTKNLLHGDENCSGFTTTGGSESIFLAVLAHKRYFFRDFGITKPELVMPQSAHPAFNKACSYLDIKCVLLKCDPKTGSVRGRDYEKKINSNTIMLIASSPNLAYGTVDPMGEVNDLAGKYKIGFMIDGCMGSLLLPFVDDFNVQTGEKYVDLRNKNCTVMSCDSHKYGLTPKGISVLLFPNIEIKKALYFGITDWVGGIYGTHSIQGSRPSHTIAAAWSVMMYHGYEGYAALAKRVFEATN